MSLSSFKVPAIKVVEEPPETLDEYKYKHFSQTPTLYQQVRLKDHLA